MATHEVKIKYPPCELGNADIVFDVKAKGSKIGTLQISKASVLWLPRDKSKRGKRLSWERFARAMEVRGSDAKVRRRRSK